MQQNKDQGGEGAPLKEKRVLREAAKPDVAGSAAGHRATMRLGGGGRHEHELEAAPDVAAHSLLRLARVHAGELPETEATRGRRVRVAVHCHHWLTHTRLRER